MRAHLLVAEGVQDGAGDLQQRRGRDVVQVSHRQRRRHRHAAALDLNCYDAADRGVQRRLQRQEVRHDLAVEADLRLASHSPVTVFFPLQLM